MSRKRVIFEVSEECLRRLQEYAQSTDTTIVNQCVKDAIYNLVNLEPEMSPRAKRKLDSLAVRKARVEMLEQELLLETQSKTKKRDPEEVNAEFSKVSQNYEQPDEPVVKDYDTVDETEVEEAKDTETIEHDGVKYKIKTKETMDDVIKRGTPEPETKYNPYLNLLRNPEETHKQKETHFDDTDDLWAEFDQD